MGYLDLLGFSRLVQIDFEHAKGVYDENVSKAQLRDSDGLWQVHPVDVGTSRLLRNSFIVVGEKFQDVANWCSGLAPAERIEAGEQEVLDATNKLLAQPHPLPLDETP